jgi:hypothetical protein
MKVKISFVWYDLWIGAFYDRKNNIIYVCPIPTILITLSFKKIEQISTGIESENLPNYSNLNKW